jgi:hypothetical protein
VSALIVYTKGDGVLGDTAASAVADIAAQVAAADRATIHLHGGLVTKATGTDAAARLDGFYRAGVGTYRVEISIGSRMGSGVFKLK